MKLVIIASVLALPISAYFISNWLNNYAFKIGMSLWFFVISVVSLAIIALGTVSYHVVKTANTNIVGALK